VAERKSHSFTVGYVPFGQDATAYYGGTDFRFVNSTRWPMKLYAAVNGNKISFAIRGTNDDPDKTVIISTKILKETPHEVRRIPDPTMPVGKTREKQEGLNGYVVDTFKTVKIKDKVVSQTKLHTSRYNPCPQEILVGTKPVPGTTPPADGTTATPGTPVTPSNTGGTPATPPEPEPVAPESGEIIDEIEPVTD